MDLAKRSNETPLQYHKRIVYGKLVDKTLSDIDYSGLSELAYGQAYSSDVARRMFYGSRRTLQMLEDEITSNIGASKLMSELDEKMVELRKERQKFFDQRAAFNKVIRERSRQEELNEILVDAVMNGSLPCLNYEPTTVNPSSNDLLISLNDIHYGISISNAWNVYNPDICAHMMRDYLDKILEIAKVHRSENCIVFNCGG